MNQQPVGYFQDTLSKVILKFEGKWDVEQMKIHKDYIEVSEKEYKEHTTPKQTVKEK